jgi:hypothetical protein
VTTARQRALGACAVLALAAAIALQAGRNAAFPIRDRTDATLLYVRSGAAVQRLALAFDALASDIYWIRAIQHYGGDRLKPGARQYELLQPLLDLTTTLDPYFTVAYRFGAIFLSEGPPGGPGRPDQAIALLRKGAAAQPHKWQYLHDIAFVHYWHRQDPAAAATWFQRAAELPGAPNWLLPVAATMVTAGDRSTGKMMWQQILQSNEAWLKRTAERRLLQLKALDQVDELQLLVNRAGLPAGSRLTWENLVRRGVLPGIPLDPTGAVYVLDPGSGRVTIAPSSALNPMPDLSPRVP